MEKRPRWPRLRKSFSRRIGFHAVRFQFGECLRYSFTSQLASQTGHLTLKHCKRVTWSPKVGDCHVRGRVPGLELQAVLRDEPRLTRRPVRSPTPPKATPVARWGPKHEFSSAPLPPPLTPAMLMRWPSRPEVPAMDVLLYPFLY